MLEQTAPVVPSVIVGKALTVRVKLLVADTQPFAFLTVNEPVYVPTGVAAGTAILIGLEVNDALVTATKLFAGDAFHVML